MNIYLDVDDTLGNFRDHAVSLGVPPWSGTWYTQDPSTWSDEQKFIQQATNDLMRTESFWLTMPLHDGAHELISAAASRAETFFLTALPSFAKDEATQKMIRQAKLEYCVSKLHFPASRVIICQRKDKVEYAIRRDGASNLLVDDAAQNCAEWRAHGGFAIHHRDCADSIFRVKDLLAK